MAMSCLIGVATSLPVAIVKSVTTITDCLTSCLADAGGSQGSEVDMELARPVSQADFEGAMKRVGPSITRGSEVAVSPGE